MYISMYQYISGERLKAPWGRFYVVFSNTCIKEFIFVLHVFTDQARQMLNMPNLAKEVSNIYNK